MTATARVPEKYICMPRPKLEDGPFSVEALQPVHIEAVRQWRNAQMDVLRQDEVITPAQQEAYYAEHIWPDMLKSNPSNILLAFKERGQLIGYGGLVHIVWEHRRAEVSFLLNPALAERQDDYARSFAAFLNLMKALAFDELSLNRLYTETYSMRQHHISILESAGFCREGVLRCHVKIKRLFVDSIIHGCVRTTTSKEEG